MSNGTAPCIFVSSTCYDLGQVREDLKSFIESLGYTAMLSEYSSFPVNPDLNTVENCRAAVRNYADVLVLVVGGRYGSLTEQGRSVTNTEYLEARAKGIPVYAFVQKSVANVLTVWKDNPGADFSRTVDSTKVFEFIESLKGSGNTWVFSFETARDIVGTLRSQLAFLFLDALRLRAKAQTQNLSPSVQQLQGDAFRIAVERPILWEHRLFSRVLAEGLVQSSALKRDLDYGMTLEQGEHIPGSLFFSWFGSQFEHLVRISSDLTELINVALPEALGPDGVSGNPEHPVYVAQRLAEGYSQAILWSLRLRCASVPEQLQPLTRMAARASVELISKLHSFSKQLEDGLNAFLMNPPSDGQQHTLEVTVTFEAPDLSDLNEELSRIHSLRRRGLLDLS